MHMCSGQLHQCHASHWQNEMQKKYFHLIFEFDLSCNCLFKLKCEVQAQLLQFGRRLPCILMQ